MSDLIIRAAIGVVVALLVFWMCERVMKTGDRSRRAAPDSPDIRKDDEMRPAA